MNNCVYSKFHKHLLTEFSIFLLDFLLPKYLWVIGIRDLENRVKSRRVLAWPYALRLHIKCLSSVLLRIDIQITRFKCQFI